MAETIYCPFCKRNRRLGPKRYCLTCKAHVQDVVWNVPPSWMSKPISALPKNTAPPS